MNKDNSNLNRLNLVELLSLAQRCLYTPPEGNMNNWNEQDIMYATTYKYINDELLMRACDVICNTVPEVKLIIKKNLRAYIKRYTDSC